MGRTPGTPRQGIVLDCELRVRERLRLLIWMRHIRWARSSSTGAHSSVDHRHLRSRDLVETIRRHAPSAAPHVKRGPRVLLLEHLDAAGSRWTDVRARTSVLRAAGASCESRCCMADTRHRPRSCAGFAGRDRVECHVARRGQRVPSTPHSNASRRAGVRCRDRRGASVRSGPEGCRRDRHVPLAHGLRTRSAMAAIRHSTFVRASSRRQTGRSAPWMRWCALERTTAPIRTLPLWDGDYLTRSCTVGRTFGSRGDDRVRGRSRARWDRARSRGDSPRRRPRSSVSRAGSGSRCACTSSARPRRSRSAPGGRMRRPACWRGAARSPAASCCGGLPLAARYTWNAARLLAPRWPRGSPAMAVPKLRARADSPNRWCDSSRRT